jgi:hypothetical protein
MISTVIRYRQDRALGNLVINQTKKPQPFLVPIARCAGGESQLASLDGVSLIMGTLYYSAERLRRECLRPRVKGVDFCRNEVLAREGTSDKDCATRLPSAAVPRLSAHLERVCTFHFCRVCRNDWDVES